MGKFDSIVVLCGRPLEFAEFSQWLAKFGKAEGMLPTEGSVESGNVLVTYIPESEVSDLLEEYFSPSQSRTISRVLGDRVFPVIEVEPRVERYRSDARCVAYYWAVRTRGGVDDPVSGEFWIAGEEVPPVAQPRSSE